VIPRLIADESVLLVVDVQDKLLKAVPTAADLVRNAGFLLDVANLLGVPSLATEQYPKGLGPTTEAILARLKSKVMIKTAFSCCGAEGFLTEVRSFNRGTVVVVGMESHVCVLQTVLDLLEAGFAVHLPIDAVASRSGLDKDAALRRLDKAGAVLTTVETVAFEWLRDAAHPSFKAVSKLILERSANP